LRQDEIGSPLLSTTKGSTLASGRVAEWKGTLKQIESRPLLGYGFGTETLVFVDRYYYFQGGTAENSFLGLMLELGGVGLLVLLSTFARLAWHGIRACRAVGGGERALLIGSLGVLASALALMFVQSYIYSVGNVGSLTVWFALFLLGVTAFAPATSGQAAGADADG
jgi:O-antigen ligase